jgi:hypothetical protein
MQKIQEGEEKCIVGGGRLHNVPEHFIIPRMSLHTLIVYWYCGSVQPHCPPLMFVRGYDFPTKKSAVQRLSQMKKMIKLVRLAARHEGFNIQQNATISTTQATQLYEATKAKFEYPAIHERTRRHESIGWKTYYNIMAKNRWKFVGDV